jgi:hypothetical protein
MKHLCTLFFGLSALISAQAQVDTLSIDSIQYISPTDLANCIDQSYHDADTVFTSGIVIVDGEKYGSTSHNIFICKSAVFTPYGCIQLRANNTDNYAEKMCDLYEGDSITVLGHVNQYEGQTQITPRFVNDAIKVISSGVSFYHTDVTAGELNDIARNNNLVDGEKYEGALVRLKNVEVASVDPFGGNRVSFVVKDASGSLVNISDYFIAGKTTSYSVTGGCHAATKTGTLTPPVVGDKLDTITGIVLHSKNNCPGQNGRGYEIHPYNASHYQWGPSAPRVSNFRRSHAAPTSSDTVIISADIVDLDGSVASATIYYATGTDVFSSFTALPMTASGNTYSAEMPKYGDGTFVRYYIRATDNLGNVTQLPNSDPTKDTKGYRVRNGGLKIFDLQYTPFTAGNSMFKDEEVTVTGIVTASGDVCDLPILHVQDEGSNSGWAGIEVTQPGGTYARGTKVTITGTVQENFGLTRIRATNISEGGTGIVQPVYVNPDSLTSYDYARNERYEGMLVGLVKSGGGKLHVVDTNADASGSFAEWRVGADALDPNNGCRVLTGRDGISSKYVSFVNSSWRVLDPLPVEKIIVSDTLTMDTLLGIMYYSFSNMKLLPRNNMDFKGVNARPSTFAPCDSDNVIIGIYTPQPSAANPDFLVFPNPAKDRLQMRNFSQWEHIHATLYDLTGKAIAGRYTKLREDVINTSHLQSGTYILEITTPQGDVLDYRKIVIE